MNLKFICIGLLIAIVPISSLKGQANENVPVKESQEEVLIADKDKKAGVTLDKLKDAEEMLMEEEEELLFPADELYGSNWDTRWVDPYKADTTGITFPDSCLVDFSAFFMPILKDTLKITSKYGPRRRRMHRGIDLKVQVGDTIYATFDGKVRIRSFQRRGYGNYLVIRHTNGLETIYGHLSKSLVEANDVVQAGEPIALGGNTGRSTGSHLHFETRFLGQALNPADVIDFENGTPYQDSYVFRNIVMNGRNTNIYTATDEQVIYHIVKSGENLGKIAQRYGTTVSELRKMNGLAASATLRIGQSLRCGIGKGSPSGAVVEEPTEQTPAIATEKKAPEETTILAANTSSQPVYHTIQAGETLGVIAKKHGITVSKLCELNNISKTTILKIGRPLKCS